MSDDRPALLDQLGLPPGVLNVLPTDRAADVVSPMLSDPRLRKLTFTGSTETGRLLASRAAEGLLRVSMELGGMRRSSCAMTPISVQPWRVR
jgi:succinate-semialdehyde dehydrogenase/glutarate-semialdehyde dehydrogenase